MFYFTGYKRLEDAKAKVLYKTYIKGIYTCIIIIQQLPSHLNGILEIPFLTQTKKENTTDTVYNHIVFTIYHCCVGAVSKKKSGIM